MVSHLNKDVLAIFARMYDPIIGYKIDAKDADDYALKLLDEMGCLNHVYISFAIVCDEEIHNYINSSVEKKNIREVNGRYHILATDTIKNWVALGTNRKRVTDSVKAFENKIFMALSICNPYLTREYHKESLQRNDKLFQPVWNYGLC